MLGQLKLSNSQFRLLGYAFTASQGQSLHKQDSVLLNDPADASAGNYSAVEHLARPRPVAPALSLIATALLLTLLCVFAYYKTLFGYFVADDLPAVADWYQIWSNNGQGLFEKLVSPWQAVSNQSFYRPLADLTLGLDYFFWKTNAFGYHLTNLFLHVGCTLLLWLFAGTITKSRLMPVLAATFFAVHPIHMEPVAWIIGRVDTLCTLFSLLSLFLFAVFLDHSKRKFLVGSVVAFAAALLSKENAVLLPLIFSLFCFAYKRSFLVLLPFAGAILFYLGLRFAVLGTIVGGYSGSIGEVSAQTIAARLLNTGTLKLFYPFNEFVHHDLSLVLFYVGCFITGMSLVLAGRQETPPSRTMKVLLLSIAMAAVTTLPALTAVYLNGTLGGGRFFYLPSAAVCIGFATLLSWLVLSRTFWIRNTARIGVGILLAALLLLCIEDGQSWVEAGNRTKAFRAAVQAKLEEHPDAVITVVSKLKQNKTEALFYNQSMQDALFKPPFSSSDQSWRVASFSWTHHIPDDPFNYSIFQNYLADGKHLFFTNDEKKRQLIPYSFKRRSVAAPVEMPLKFERRNSSPKTRYTLIADREIDPQALSLLEMEISVAKSVLPGTKEFVLRWQGARNLAAGSRERTVLISAGRRQTIYQHLSEEPAWVLADAVSNLEVETGANVGLQLHSARLVNSSYLYPRLIPDRQRMSLLQDGSMQYKNDVQFDFDASNVYTAVAVLIEVSKSDCFFEHYTGTFHDSRPCNKAFKRLTIQRNRGKFRIAATELPPGRCQIRLAPLDKAGDLIGFTSDPITLVRF